MITNKPNFFVYGLSGSGKDTLSNFLWETYGYRKLRIAKTIKHVVSETNNLHHELLETAKRENLKLRKQHKDVSDYMDVNCVFGKHNLNRLRMMIDESAYDYEMLTKEELKNKAPKIFIDVRGVEEAEILLESGAIGIFLKRGSDNDANKNHWTEKSMFAENKKGESQMKKLHALFPNQCYIVDNSNDPEILIGTENFIQFEEATVTGEILIREVDKQIFQRLIK